MAGFKSFAEKAELEIKPGLTGIVGPNGCGKSNIVEGLRFIMGESSARQLRGTELDDIIFSGTQSRPSRNIAEITLQLDNRMKTAPAEYNQFDDLEIVRKVERGKGSQFRINGRHARAKDVQLLFADSATGARAAGMVSQGRIGAIIGAKPENRRGLIEEAANIKGLQQRKNEAESRLRSTELNLERLTDMITQLKEQRNQLAKQARQAARYRSVAERIRKAEARLAHARWQKIEIECQTAKIALETHSQQVTKATLNASGLSAKQAKQAAILPPLRLAEAEQAASVQTMRMELEECDRENQRVLAALNRLAQQIEQLTKDAERETHLHDDGMAALTALQAEQDLLQAHQHTHTPDLTQAQSNKDAAQLASTQASIKSTQAQAQLVSAKQSKQQLNQRMHDLTGQIYSATKGLVDLETGQRAEEAKQAGQLRDQGEAESQSLKLTRATRDKQLATLQHQREIAHQARAAADIKLTKHTAEINALAYLSLESGADSQTPIADKLTVLDDMELALSVCLGTDLNLPYDSGEHGYWRQDIDRADHLEAPAIGQPLTNFISGSKSIARTLAGISVVTHADNPKDAQNKLSVGQALVSKDGHLWRWDGLIRKGQVSSEAERIRQRQRLHVLKGETAALTTAFESCDSDFRAIEDRFHLALAALKETETALQASQDKADKMRRTADSAALALSSAKNRAGDLQIALDAATAERSALAADERLEGNLDALGAAAESLSAQDIEYRSLLDEAIRNEIEIRQTLRSTEQRLAVIAQQEQDWKTRLAQTGQRKQDITSRDALARKEREALLLQPAKIEIRKMAIADQMNIQEAERQKRSDHLSEAERHLTELDNLLRAAERELSKFRESLIRAESLCERLQSERADMIVRIREKLDCPPEDLAEHAQISPDQPSEHPIDKLVADVNRLLTERDQMGPVNLRAEAEMGELDERVELLQSEHDDLIEAITKLRSAISTLNREGRARLLQSFANVNRYFSELFVTLFGGGHAELQLTHFDDPLQAGIEIYARPPGKKMQSLSLLSGGEQALTALAIIFAAFLTNPAPICVLDEVDAPLDDSNVARFCDLLNNIAERTQTRFLIITHHRMTMARMDRLFGVTMEQKGVSRLVSVDLQTAEGLRDSQVA